MFDSIKHLLREIYQIVKAVDQFWGLVGVVLILLSVAGIAGISLVLPDSWIPTHAVEFRGNGESVLATQNEPLPRLWVALFLGLILLVVWVFAAGVRLNMRARDSANGDRRLDDLSELLTSGSSLVRDEYILHSDPEEEAKVADYLERANVWDDSVQAIFKCLPYTQTDLVKYSEPPPRTGLQTRNAEASKDYWNVRTQIEDRLITLRQIIDQYS